MAVKKVYVDLDGGFINTLLNWRLTNLTTAQRNQLATQLGVANIGLPVFYINLNSLFIWGGSTWLPVGGSGTGVSSFNTRTGAVTLESLDVTTALGFIPVSGATGNNGDIQFNNSGAFGGTDQFVWNITNDNLLIGSNIDNDTARIQSIDGTGQNQLALHYDDSNYAAFLVDNIGDLTISSTGAGGSLIIIPPILANNSIYIAIGNYLAWGNLSSFSTILDGNTNGILRLFDSSLASFNMIQFGGTTTSYPGLKRNAANLEVKLSDDSAYSNFALSKLLMQSSVLGTPVNGTLETDYTNLYFTLGGVRKQVSFGTFNFELSTTGTTGAATYVGTQLNVPIYQGQLTLTTTGTTGVATLVGNDLNIPNYTAPSGYTLPPATYSSLGGVIVGSNLWVNSSGLLNLQGSGVTSALGYTPLDPSGTSAQYFAGNGQLITFPTIPTPGGSNTDIQFNNSGSFGGTGALTWNGSLFYVSGNTQITSLASTGTTMVVATSTGLLQTQSIPQGAVSSVSNSDGSLTISPTTGAVIASLNVGHSNTFSAAQTIGSISNGTPLTIINSLTGTNTSPILQFTTTVNNGTTSSNLIQVSASITATGASTKFINFFGGTSGSQSAFSVGTDGSTFVSSGNFTSGGSTITLTTTTGHCIFTSANLYGTNDFFFQGSAGASGYAVFEASAGIGAVSSTFGSHPWWFAPNRTLRGGTTGGGNWLWGTTTDNSTANTQLFNGSGAQLALHYSNSAYTKLTTNSSGVLNIAPTGITTIFAAATASGASINIPTGVAPTTPNEGDMWKTGTHLFIYLNGSTVQIV